MLDEFYRAFEDRYRGKREYIKSRQSIYLPFIKTIQKIYPEGEVLDIGCGRGEWLELLKENNIKASGVDIDKYMLNVAKDYSLDVKESDGLSTLKSIKDNSLTAVTAFHVVEHIPFESLLELIAEAKRVLVDGGLLIMETPNPENIKVSTEFFYIDPTHKNPIPMQLLSFASEYQGFKRVEAIRVNDNEFLKSQKYGDIWQVIEGVSQDYAVVAQKDAKEDILSQFDALFEVEYGTSFSKVVSKFEKRLNRVDNHLQLIREYLGRFDELDEKFYKIDESFKWYHNKIEFIESRVKEIDNLYHMIKSSEKSLRSTMNSMISNIESEVSELTDSYNSLKESHKRLENDYMNLLHKHSGLEEIVKDMREQINAGCSIIRLCIRRIPYKIKSLLNKILHSNNNTEIRYTSSQVTGEDVDSFKPVDELERPKLHNTPKL